MRYIALIGALLVLFGCMGTTPGSGMHGIQTGSEIEPNRSVDSLPVSLESRAIAVADGSTFNLAAAPVIGDIGGNRIRMLAYNGQIPGPVLKVKQGSTVYVNFTNDLDSNTTVHWHGIRLENKYDGVPDITQQAVKPGESFLYKLTFPDEGMYWYHPHVREDYQQELGLYGVIMVEPNETGYYNQVDQEEIIVLDDMLLKGGDVYQYDNDTTNFALMGRFGNVNLINGKTDYKLKVKKGQTVRFFVLDAANVRPYNLSIEDTKIKVVGSDGGKYEKEFMTDSVVITPSERYIFEASFNKSGTYGILNVNPFYRYTLGTIEVEDSDSVTTEAGLKENSDIESEVAQYSEYFNKTPDLEYTLTIGIEGGMMGGMMMDHTEDGIEWEDTMEMMNRNSGSDRVTWIIKDKKSGKNNMDAVEAVPKNKPVKIRIENDDKSVHPMQHTIHLHGAQFLVLKTDDIENDNLVWKDSVNIPSGGSIEILAVFPNEGEWMMHCHIAEHLGSGMMTSFMVGNDTSVFDEDSIENKFNERSAAKTNYCADSLILEGKEDGERLQGSCCSPMDFHRYAEQVSGLEKYAYIDKIPSDPYDITVSLANELLGYQNITLTSEQQSIYDEAVRLSDEGGPCCCKCWRWYAFEGLAKYLITEHNFTSEQIAEVWDLEDGCGGPGHGEGVPP